MRRPQARRKIAGVPLGGFTLTVTSFQFKGQFLQTLESLQFWRFFFFFSVLALIFFFFHKPTLQATSLLLLLLRTQLPTYFHQRLLTTCFSPLHAALALCFVSQALAASVWGDPPLRCAPTPSPHSSCRVMTICGCGWWGEFVFCQPSHGSPNKGAVQGKRCLNTCRCWIPKVLGLCLRVSERDQTF